MKLKIFYFLTVLAAIKGEVIQYENGGVPPFYFVKFNIDIYYYAMQCRWPSNISHKLLNWTKDGKDLTDELSSGDMLVFTDLKQNRSVLIIRTVLWNHRGMYKCMNEHEGSYVLTADHFDNITALNDLYSGPTTRVIKGQNVMLDCNIKTALMFNTNLTTYYWTRDNQPIPRFESIVQVLDDNRTRSQLFINRASKIHSGRYRCIPDNDRFLDLTVLDDNSTGGEIYSGIQDPTSSKNVYDYWIPGLLAHCKNITPGDQIYWMRNGQKIPELSSGYMNVIVSHDKRESFLAVGYAKRSLKQINGNYSCVQGNPKFHQVNVSPDKYIGKNHAKLGHPFHIFCFGGSEIGQYSWTKDGKPLKPGRPLLSNLIIDSYWFGSTLFGIRAFETDAGEYKCPPDSKHSFNLEIILPNEYRYFYQSYSTQNIF